MPHSHAHDHADPLDGGRSLKLAAALSFGLSLAKLTLGLISGSLAVMASAADSFSDGAMSTLNAWGYGWAREPADAEHPFGHGKLEGALSVAQGALLLGILSALAVGSLQGVVEGRPVPRVGLAVATLAGSAVVSALLTWLLRRAASGEVSLILEADAAHYRLDFLSGALAIGGLLAAGALGWTWLDPVLCLLLGVFMAPDCIHLLREGVGELLDEGLPEEEVAQVRGVLEGLELDYHGLRTRKSGPLRFVEVHLTLDPRMKLGDAHGLVQAVADEIREALPRSRVLVHPDAHGLVDRTDDELEGSGERPALAEGAEGAPAAGEERTATASPA
ncbi:MAG: cation diffusion facilitator family transporter [Planctomycetota bacterium]